MKKIKETKNQRFERVNSSKSKFLSEERIVKMNKRKYLEDLNEREIENEIDEESYYRYK